MKICTTLVALAALLLSAAVAADDDGWVRITAPAEFMDNGVLRTPRCSGGPIVPEPTNPSFVVEADKEFSFFIRYGHPGKLAILFDGGGACYDTATCLIAAQNGFGTYSPEADETAADLGATGGLGDEDDSRNPIRSFTQVFIPYCTADLHTGAKDQTYPWPGGVGTPGGDVNEWTIHHRGADNVAYVLHWLDTEYFGGSWTVSDVFATGLSAGGYGVVYHTPAIAGRLPWYARLRVLADAANGVITSNFFNAALSPAGVWNAQNPANLSPVLAPAFAAGPDNIIIEFYKALGGAYPAARFGQYTTAFDTTQIFFYNIDRNPGDFLAWINPLELVVAGFDWTLRARTYQILTALQTWNYRYYLAKGDAHTVLADDNFYTENTGSGIRLYKWVDDMINRFWFFGGNWRNASCTPNCPP